MYLVGTSLVLSNVAVPTPICFPSCIHLLKSLDTQNFSFVCLYVSRYMRVCRDASDQL